MKKKFLSKLLICSLIMQSVFLFSDTTYFLNNTHVSAAITGKSPFTSSTYTHNDIFKNYNIYNGIDVSKYNGDINWDKVKKDGVDFLSHRPVKNNLMNYYHYERCAPCTPLTKKSHNFFT